MGATVNLNTADPDSVPVRDAATVMLVRDGDRGLEVCMLQRNLNSDFVGGAYVFPGGGVDPGDASPNLHAVASGRSDSDASTRVGVERGGLAFWVAAIRESFEEAGVLLATDRAGSVLSLAEATVRDRFVRHRRAVDRGERELVEICVEEELQLDVGAMHYFSRWVTPLGAPRRYDTRFFVAEAPSEQEALHDDNEVIGTRWLTPADALEDHVDGRITMIFPTVRTMVALEQYRRVEDLMAHAGSIRSVDPILPLMSQVDDRLVITLPGDPESTGGVYDAMTAAVI